MAPFKVVARMNLPVELAKPPRQPLDRKFMRSGAEVHVSSNACPRMTCASLFEGCPQDHFSKWSSLIHPIMEADRRPCAVTYYSRLCLPQTSMVGGKVSEPSAGEPAVFPAEKVDACIDRVVISNARSGLMAY